MLFRSLSTATLAALTIWIVGCNRTATEFTEPTTLPVKVAKVVRRTEFSYPLKFFGRVNAARESTLSFELAGLVAAIAVDEGDEVGQGQLLASLNTDILTAQRKLLIAKRGVEDSLLKRLQVGERPEIIAAAQAAVERLNVEVKLALINEQREQKLLEKKSISESRYDQLKYDYESLTFSLAEAQARLEELQSGPREEDIEAQKKRLESQEAEITVLDTRIKRAGLLAPFNGQVTDRVIDEGTVVDAGQPVLVVLESTKREARFSLPIMHLDQVSNVKSVKVGDREIRVQDYRIVSRVDSSTRTVDVKFVLESTNDLLAGETCIVELTKTVEKNCVELSVSALVPSIRGLWSCYRIEETADGNGFLIVKEEITIEHTDGDRVFVESTLPDDALIVTEGVQKLVPGMHVRPLGEKR